MEQSKFDSNLSNQPQLLVKHLKYIGQDRTLRSYFCHYGKKKKKREREKETDTTRLSLALGAGVVALASAI